MFLNEKYFLENEEKYLAHLHKQLKPATYLRFRVSRVITFASGFHIVLEFNIRYFKWGYQPLENLNL